MRWRGLDQKGVVTVDDRRRDAGKVDDLWEFCFQKSVEMFDRRVKTPETSQGVFLPGAFEECLEKYVHVDIAHDRSHFPLPDLRLDLGKKRTGARDIFAGLLLIQKPA